MEGCYIFKKNPINIAHLPTLMLVIGYPIYWAEMLSGHAKGGLTSPLVWWLFTFFVVFVTWREKQAIIDFKNQCLRSFLGEKRYIQVFLIIGCVISIFVVICALLASLLPPHLLQESDTMNYHMTIPRQHLILGSFSHIPWSADDFFFLPIDFALAPFWFVSPLPNKIPQLIFFLGLLCVTASLSREFKSGPMTAAFISVFALLGSHGHGVQIGTAMMDLPICYLFLAFLDSFLKRQKWLFIFEFTFFVWAKSLVPVQVIVLAAGLGCLFFIMTRAGYVSVLWDFQRKLPLEEMKRCGQFFSSVWPGILIMSIVVAGPFLAKSLYYTGTPFFPIGIGMTSFHPGIQEGSVGWSSLVRSAEFLNTSIHRDGYGRSLFDFLTHFWALAVPNDKVNNAFDYPMGLSYLIFLGPFLLFWFRSLFRKEIALLPWMIVVYWILWWFSVRETRHLYAPVLLMMIVSIVSLKNWSKVLLFVLLTAMVLNGLSVFRAHHSYFGHSRENVLRAEDKILVDLSRQYILGKRSDMVESEQYEAAFALFPVVVRREILPHVIAF